MRRLRNVNRRGSERHTVSGCLIEQGTLIFLLGSRGNDAFTLVERESLKFFIQKGLTGGTFALLSRHHSDTLLDGLGAELCGF